MRRNGKTLTHRICDKLNTYDLTPRAKAFVDGCDLAAILHLFAAPYITGEDLGQVADDLAVEFEEVFDESKVQP